jgi:hypothetical protein
MPLEIQERHDLETTMSTYPRGQVAFAIKGRRVHIIGGDQATRLTAYWHMCASDREFWDMVDSVSDVIVYDDKWASDGQLQG